MVEARTQNPYLSSAWTAYFLKATYDKTGLATQRAVRNNKDDLRSHCIDVGNIGTRDSETVVKNQSKVRTIAEVSTALARSLDRSTTPTHRLHTQRASLIKVGKEAALSRGSDIVADNVEGVSLWNEHASE